MATEQETTPTFVTATQKWVMNRLSEIKSLIMDVKSGLLELITALRGDHVRDMQTVAAKFAELADHTVTGKLTVEGDTKITGNTEISGPLTATGMSSAAPIACTDPAGLLLKTPGREPVGLNPTTLSLLNERGKVARFFMRGDKLCYDYAYDKIYVYFNEEIGSTLRYLKRGGTRLAQIVANTEQHNTNEARLAALETWFNIPLAEGEHMPARLFGTTVYELYPALGTPFMIPESMLFTVPETYKIDSLKLLNSTGQAVSILKDFRGAAVPIKKLLINFPYIHTVEGTVPSGAGIPPMVRRDEAEDVTRPELAATGVGTGPVYIPHIADYDHAYYEFTDRDARFAESVTDGLIPNVVLRLCDFPRDIHSVLYFNVVQA